MCQQWRAVGNSVSDLAGPKFEPLTSRFKRNRVTAQPTGRHVRFIYNENNTSAAVLTMSMAKKYAKDKSYLILIWVKQIS